MVESTAFRDKGNHLLNTRNMNENNEKYKLPVSEKRLILKEYKEVLKQNATDSEMYFRRKLYEYGIEHEFQRGVIDGEEFIIADYYIKRINLIVEIDGGCHETKKQKIRDYYKDLAYKERGYNVLRIKNEDITQFDYVELAKSYYTNRITDKLFSLLKIAETKPIVYSKTKTSKGKKSITKEGQPCRKCNTPVVVRHSKKHKKNVRQKYYFESFCYCPKCGAMYMIESSKKYY